MQSMNLTSEELRRLASPAELLDRQWAPCRYNCPVHANVRLYLEHASQGRFRQAIDVIRDSLPLAAICGRICHHPCEANCRRNDVDEPVGIREVKRYLAETLGASGATVHKANRQDRARVAIVGAGPAGLSAALELAKLGYRPTIFEKFLLAGGIPATAIPRYRLPIEVVQIDVDWIKAHGVEIKTGMEIGKDKGVGDLLAEGFAAVLIAAGLAKSRTLPLTGADNPRVYPVLEFLQGIAFGKPAAVGQSVLVIGGGNVAVDAARSALRLGAKTVRMMCLEDPKEMPAWLWEQEEACQEGIETIYRRGPMEIIVQAGQIKAMRARQVVRVFDENKRFSPQYDDSDTITVDCDTVILAIGQEADNGFIAGTGLQINDRGRLSFDQASYQTNLPNIFACGEIVTAPGSVVEACASGKRAASAIDQYLRGMAIRVDDALRPYITAIEPAVGLKVTKVARQTAMVEPASTRRGNFGQFDHTYSTQQMLSEARRCMGCGGGAEVLVDKCAACLTCLRVCPFGIPKVTDVASIDSALCQACGMCIAECPANAIVAKGWGAGDIIGKTKAGLAGLANSPRKTIAYICGQHSGAAAWQGTGQCDQVAGLVKIFLPSLARLGTPDLLKAFELGATSVVVAALSPAAERYPQATARMKKRVAQARDLLAQAGIAGERLVWLELQPADVDDPSGALSALICT
jgi:NADPH-dependent glutamate synthase beta subunit-like oxidoreductase/coenzyme F420-reducing hydrogenase delta subunit/ferredoxin